MANIKNKSVQSFIIELQKRMALLNTTSSSVITNIEDYEKLSNIFSKYTQASLENITISVLKDIGYNDLSEILSIVGPDASGIDKYLNEFKTIDGDYTTQESIELLIEVHQLISDFASSYADMHKNQIGMMNAKQQQYQSYIDLFSKEKFDSLFLDIDELRKIISTFGISKEDEWQILEFIAKQNIAYQQEQYLDVDLLNQVTEVTDKYLREENNVLPIIKGEIEHLDIDVELIKDLVADISSKYDIDANLCHNTLCSIVLSTLMKKYQSLAGTSSKIEELKEIEELIKSVLSKMEPRIALQALEAIAILTKTKDFYENETKSSSIDIMKYLDLSIAEIENENVSHDEAVDLKTLPIIKTIKETITKFEETIPGSNDETMILGIIEELVVAYNNVYTKKLKM